MKKLFFIAVLLSSFQGVKAQMTTGGKGSDCISIAMNSLSTCLTSNNVIFDLTTDESGTVSIVAQGNTPPGQIQSCIAHYNQTKADCPEAPPVVNKSTTSGNQIEKTPH